MPNFRTLGPTFEKIFTGAKVQSKAQKIGVGRKSVYEIETLSEYRMFAFKD